MTDDDEDFINYMKNGWDAGKFQRECLADPWDGFAEFIDRDEAVRLNLVAHLTTDDHYRIGAQQSTMLHHLDRQQKKMADMDYLRRLRISRALTSEGKR